VICKKLRSKLNFSGRDVVILLFVAVSGLAAVWAYFNLDKNVFSSLRQKPLDWDDLFWVEPITFVGKTGLQIWLILIWFLFKKNQRPILISFLALLVGLTIVVPLKFGAGRPRPYEIIKAEQDPNRKLELDNYTSFPSGDTATAFAIAAVVVSLATWPWACVLLAISAAVALLRVTAMAHYPSDVFAGAAIGILAGWIAVQIDRRWLPLIPPRFDLKPNWAILAIIIIPIIMAF
jgi:undecaprenyl-diphosphatase